MPRKLSACLLVASIGISVTFSAISPPFAQPQCNQRDDVLRVLQDKYKESPVAIGVTHNGGLVEVLTTENGDTWSIIVTTPQGISCLVAAGEGWHTKPPLSAPDPKA